MSNVYLRSKDWYSLSPKYLEYTILKICICFVLILLGGGDFSLLALEDLSDYPVSVRYDFEFWLDVGLR